MAADCPNSFRYPSRLESTVVRASFSRGHVEDGPPSPAGYSKNQALRLDSEYCPSTVQSV